MKLTPEQKSEIDRQRREDPERRHFMLTFTPEQKVAWERAVAEEMAYKDANIRHFRKLTEAAEEPTFSGQLRRAINASGHEALQFPEKIGVDPQVFTDFRTGEASLPSDAIDRLIRELNLTIEMQPSGSATETSSA